MSVRATTLEERRLQLRRKRAHEADQRYVAAKICEEEEVATYLSLHPMFAQGLLEMSEANFVSLMLGTRQLMLNRQGIFQRNETVTETRRKWK